METPKVSHLRPARTDSAGAAERDRQRMEGLIEKLYAAASAEARIARVEEKLDEILEILKSRSG